MAVESNRYARRLYRTRVCADRSASLSAISDGGMSWDDVPFVPCYDSNGNVTRYLDASGRTVAQYVYDAFGGMVAASGPLADTFTFGFSTKCRDREACLVAYQRRFYSPGLGRWLNRDPIGEIDDGCMSIGNWGAQFRQSFDEGEQVVGRLSYLMLS